MSINCDFDKERQSSLSYILNGIVSLVHSHTAVIVPVAWQSMTIKNIDECIYDIVDN